MAMRSCWFLFIAVTLVVVLHVKARDIPNPKNIDNYLNNNATQSQESSNVVSTNTNNNVVPTKDVPKKGDEVNKDDKHFISFGGMGAAGGVGGVAGIVPIDFIDKGLGGGLPTFGGPLGGGGLGGGLGGGGAGGGGCPTGSSTGGTLPLP